MFTNQALRSIGIIIKIATCMETREISHLAVLILKRKQNNFKL